MSSWKCSVCELFNNADKNQCQACFAICSDTKDDDETPNNIPSNVNINLDEDKYLKEMVLERAELCVSRDKSSYSFTKILQHTSKCLISGYISSISSYDTYSVEISSLCFSYFIGGFPGWIYDDTLSKYNSKAKNEIIQICYNVLCPGNNNDATQSLKHLIDILSAFCYHIKKYPESEIDAEYHIDSYLSIITSLNQISYLYDILPSITVDPSITEQLFDQKKKEESPKKTKEERSYGGHLLDIAYKYGVSGIGVELIYNLLLNNNRIFDEYKKISQPFSEHYIELFIKKNSILDIIALRKLLYFKLNDVSMIKDSDQVIVTKIMEQISTTKESHLSTTKKKESHLLWLWLQKEIEYTLSISNNQYPICHLPQLIINTIQKQNNDKDFEVAAEILYALIEINKLVLLYEIEDHREFAKLVTFMLGYAKYEIIGWKILYNEILRIHQYGRLIVGGYIKQIYDDNTKFIPLDVVNECAKFCNKQYLYQQEWIEYIESKIGLMKMNFVSSIKLLKKKNESDLEMARLCLQIATKTCYIIHVLVGNQLTKFDAFYSKLKQTKIIKPILKQISNMTSNNQAPSNINIDIKNLNSVSRTSGMVKFDHLNNFI